MVLPAKPLTPADAALQAMCSMARDIFDLTMGVAIISVWQTSDDQLIPGVIRTQCLDSFYRDPDPEDKFDQGANCLGIVLGKLAFAVRTLENNGQGRSLFGESEFCGLSITLIGEGKYLIVGFSGATEDQDMDIATAGQLAFIAKR